MSRCDGMKNTGAAFDLECKSEPHNNEISHVEYAYMRIMQSLKFNVDDKWLTRGVIFLQNSFVWPSFVINGTKTRHF